MRKLFPNTSNKKDPNRVDSCTYVYLIDRKNELVVICTHEGCDGGEMIDKIIKQTPH